jgi:hypothetical protein
MGANGVFKSRMEELGLTQEELAGRMNAALAQITGRPGDVSDRTIRNLLNGTSRRPIGRRVPPWSGCSVVPSRT